MKKILTLSTRAPLSDLSSTHSIVVLKAELKEIEDLGPIFFIII